MLHVVTMSSRLHFTLALIAVGFSNTCRPAPVIEVNSVRPFVVLKQLERSGGPANRAARAQELMLFL